MNNFFFKGSVLLLVLAVVSAQKTTKKPNVPDFEDRYVANPFTQEELEALSGGSTGTLGGSVGIVPPSDTQGGGGNSGGIFNPPVNQPTPSTTTTEDFSSVFLGNQPQPQQQPQPQPQPQVQPQPQQPRPGRPGGPRPSWNRRPSWGGRRDFNSQW